MIQFLFRLFRYGREDEEVMGLKFCNEAIIALKQIWPRTEETEELSQLQVTKKIIFFVCVCVRIIFKLIAQINILSRVIFWKEKI